MQRPKTTSPLLISALAAIGLLSASCAGLQTEAGGSPAPKAQASESSGPAAAEKVGELRWKVELAERGLRSARMGADADLQRAEAAVVDAERDLMEARMALDAFTEMEMVHKTGEAALGLQRQRNRAVEAKMELEELEAMYAEDDFAGKTKELVIERGRRNLALTERQLELGELAHELLTGSEMPMKARKLERSVAKAERALANAQADLERKRFDSETKLMEAERKLEQAQKELNEAVEA